MPAWIFLFFQARASIQLGGALSPAARVLPHRYDGEALQEATTASRTGPLTHLTPRLCCELCLTATSHALPRRSGEVPAGDRAPLPRPAPRLCCELRKTFFVGPWHHRHTSAEEKLRVVPAIINRHYFQIAIIFKMNVALNKRRYRGYRRAFISMRA